MQIDVACVLCGEAGTRHFHRDGRRDYLRCPNCSLVFVPQKDHLDPVAEKAEYDLHCNNPADPGYREFLSRLQLPLCARLPGPGRGLDFGCGPGPTLSRMLEERGHSVALYDKFYYPDCRVLSGHYDFVTATEVAEHLAEPGRILSRLWRLLPQSGYLGLMTKLVRNRRAFANWHYKNDPTHICFFSSDTWRWWGERNHARLEIIGADVILLQKQHPH